MPNLRACFRLLVLVKVAIFGLLVVLGGSMLSYPFPHHRDRWRQVSLRWWCRTLLRVMGARVENRGAAPTTPFLLLPRQLDWLHMLVLASRVSGIFVAGGEISERSGVRALSRALGTESVDLQAHCDLESAAARIYALLERSDAVILCPEGTGGTGGQVDPMRSELLKIVVRAGHALSYSSLDDAAGRGGSQGDLAVRARDNMEFVNHLWRLLSEPGFTVTLTLSDRPIRARDFRRARQNRQGELLQRL